MIITYHKIAEAVHSYWYVTANAFERQLEELASKTFVFLDDYDPHNDQHVSIHFHGVYKNVLHFAAPILQARSIPFEAFVIGDHIGGNNSFDTVEPLTDYCTLDELELIQSSGGRLQWHTRSHRQLDLLTPEEVEREVTPPTELIERFPHSFKWFAYPHSVVNLRTLDLVKKQFVGAVANESGDATNRYALPSIEMNEQTRFRKETVSIIVANYNYGRFLTEAVESVVSQTQSPDEILVIDDASTDGSNELLFDLQRKYPQIRVEINQTNLGIVENFRKAVGMTSGDFIGFLGADNRMRADYVARCSHRLSSNPRLGIAYTDMTIFGHRSQDLASSVGATSVAESIVDRSAIFYWAFPEPSPERISEIERRNFIHGSSMYRRAAYDEVGGYIPSSGPEDANLFARILSKGWQCSRVSEALIAYRQHSTGQANNVLSLQLTADAWQRIATQAQTDLAERAQALAAGQEQATVLTNQLADLQCQLRSALDERDRLLAEVAAIRSMYEDSVAWRATLPFRLVLDAAKRLAVKRS
jgi:GT2 family glycosyltransferase/peptidoglycan/xylan/chitin deacetylase (PgdA/CDA1 family)